MAGELPELDVLVLGGNLAMALAVFCLAAALRGWQRWRHGCRVAACGTDAGPPRLPRGKVPVWFYQPVDLLGAALVFGIFGGLSLAGAGVAEDGVSRLNAQTMWFNIGFQFLIAGMVAATVILRRVGLASWLGLRWQGWPWMFLIAPGTVVFMWLVFGGLQISGYVKWMESLGVETVQDTVKLLQESSDPQVLGLMAFAAVVAAPLCEEIVFRGYFYPVLKKFAGMPVALVCSSLVFAAAHGNLTALLPLFLFGGVLVYLYEKSGSLWLPVAAHFCFNGATVLVQLALRYHAIPLQPQ